MILSGLPEIDGNRQVDKEWMFEHARILGDIDLVGLRFDCEVQFNGASFGGLTFFSHLEGAHEINLDGTSFDKDFFLLASEFPKVSMANAVVGGNTSIQGRFPNFEGSSSTFDGRLRFLDAHIEDRLELYAVEVKGSFQMYNMSGGAIDFSDSYLLGRVRFRDLNVEEVSANRTILARPGDIGSLDAKKLVDLRDSSFEGAVFIRSSSQYLDIRRATFKDRANLEVYAYLIAMAHSAFQQTSTIAAGPKPQSWWDHSAPDAPSLGQLIGADVGHLTLEGLDLSTCHFGGARNLDRMRLLDLSTLPTVRNGWWKRQIVRDEYIARGQPEGWEVKVPPLEPEPLTLAAGASTQKVVPSLSEVAEVYRSLRRGRESREDASGATDFYVGEMETRRLDEGGLLLWSYRLVSGYGTRARRSALTYAILVAVLTAFFAIPSGHDSMSVEQSGAFVLASTVFVSNLPSGFELTASGMTAQLLLRVLGPVLLGLTLIALRTRVKR